MVLPISCWERSKPFSVWHFSCRTAMYGRGLCCQFTKGLHNTDAALPTRWKNGCCVSPPFTQLYLSLSTGERSLAWESTGAMRAMSSSIGASVLIKCKYTYVELCWGLGRNANTTHKNASRKPGHLAWCFTAFTCVFHGRCHHPQSATRQRPMRS